MVRGFIDCTCHKCGGHVGWCGTMTDRPACPKCGDVIPKEELEIVEQAVTEMIEEGVKEDIEKEKKLTEQLVKKFNEQTIMNVCMSLSDDKVFRCNKYDDPDDAVLSLKLVNECLSGKCMMGKK